MTGFVRCAGALTALAICSACGSGSAVSPSIAAFDARSAGRTLYVNGMPVTAANLNPSPRFAELVPDLSRRRKKFEYVINHYGTFASVFDYPKSKQQIDSINGAGGQGCTNVLYGYGKKIIWNPGRTNNLITEYAVGSDKVLKTLSLDEPYTSSCAMNASGDLAVGVLLGTSSKPGGQVVIFKHASGAGRAYPTPLAREYFDGYDFRGNLFADGFTGGSAFGLVELPQGSSKAVTIKTTNSPDFPGSVQWDGTYLSVFDQVKSRFYQYAVKGTTATLKHTIVLTGTGDCAQTWIVKGFAYCGDAGNSGGEVFKYPSGGAPIASFKGSFDEPLGMVAAEK